ncbi:MAG: pilin [Candidatus Parcubacteria bacterium]|nr:pilin [Candidatus Parcubacteria bacterium]
MTKRKFLIIFFILLGLGLALSQVWAYSFSDITGFSSTTAGEAGLTKTSTSDIVASVIKIVLSITGALFVILFIYGGFVWLTSTGNPEKIGKAKKAVSFAVVGALIVVAAYSITTYVVSLIPSGTAPAAGTPTTGTGSECQAACQAGVTCICSDYDSCTTLYQGTSLGVKDCGSNICCQKPTSTVDCHQCGRGLTHFCTQSVCDAIDCRCHFHFPSYCDYDSGYDNGGGVGNCN